MWQYAKHVGGKTFEKSPKTFKELGMQLQLQPRECAAWEGRSGKVNPAPPRPPVRYRQPQSPDSKRDVYFYGRGIDLPGGLALRQ